MPGTGSVFAERVMGGNYVEFDIDRDAIARYGLTMGDVQDVLEVALGGMPLTTTVEGLERYGVILRYDRDYRENLEALRRHRHSRARRHGRCPGRHGAGGDGIGRARTAGPGAARPARQAARRRRPDGHQERGRRAQRLDLRRRARHRTSAPTSRGPSRPSTTPSRSGELKVPTGYSIFWSGQFEYMQRAQQRLMIVIPLTLLIIVLIIYLNTQSLVKTAIVLLAVPFSLVGRVLDALPFRLQPERGRLGRHHRARRPRCRDRRGDAALPRPRL